MKPSLWLIFSGCLLLLLGCQSPVVPSTPTQTPPSGTIWAIYQSFEHGFMLWREDQACAYAFAYSDAYPDGFIIIPPDIGTPSLEMDYHYCLAAPPTHEPAAIQSSSPDGLLVPTGMLGNVWTHYQALPTGLGYAAEPEQPYAASLPPCRQPHTAVAHFPNPC